MRTQNKLIIGIGLAFFVAVNTIELWGDNLGFWSFLISILLFFVFLGLCITAFTQIYFGFRENFRNRERLKVICFTAIVLVLIFLAPLGLFNLENLEANDIIIARREGVAGCSIILKLKEDNTFVFNNICFGTSKTTGKYHFVGDSLFFKDIKIGRDDSNFYEFGLKDTLDIIWLYYDKQDTSGICLHIINSNQKNQEK
ncbi:hypothetical protein [Mariniradius saccharolyticus]|uniref:hypothetical protein n=1 Tax=Mariniradius saccharolyticus TaxID=1245591 RepID=UPI000311254C|nr:hypothetical protein [Mariniradius saccharolyticus]